MTGSNGLPDGWKRETIGQCTSVKRGASPRPIEDPKWWGGEIGWVRIADVTSSRKYLTKTRDYLSNEGVRKSIQIQVGEVILSICATIGRPIITTIPVCIHDGFVWFKGLPTDIDREYFYYYLASKESELANSRQTGTQGNLNTTIVSNLEFVHPISKKEQAKIAEILSTIDTAIEQTVASISKQRSMKTGLVEDLLTRGIDKDGNVRSERRHKFQDSVLGRIPGEWEVQTLGAALQKAHGFLQTGPFGSQLHAHEYVNEGIPVVMPQDILSGLVSTAAIARITECKAAELKRHRVKPNDMVFSRRGDLSRAAAIGEREEGWVCGTGCFLLRVPASEMDSRWLAQVYRHHHVQRQVETNAVGSTMPSLNNSVMGELTIAFPAIEEQREITRRLDAMDTTISAMSDSLGKLISMRVGLMEDLLSGSTRVMNLLDETKPKREKIYASQ